MCAHTKTHCWCTHVWIFLCVWHTSVFVWVSVCTGWCCAGFWILLELFQKGWMDGGIFFQSILLKIPISPLSPLSPKTPKESSMHQFFGFLCSGRKQKMELLIGLTSPRCCCSARSGQHCSYDECLISRNTSQIAKLYLPWIAKCIFFCSVAGKQLWTTGLLCPHSQVFQDPLFIPNNGIP